VNYVYDLEDVERNHEEYVNRHRAVCSGAVDKQARSAEGLLAGKSQVASSAPAP
jgi:hypothetical protein